MVDISASPAYVLWVIQDTFTVRCDFNMTWFPFDIQDCSLSISTIQSVISRIYLNVVNQKYCMDIQAFHPNQEFDVSLHACTIDESIFLVYQLELFSFLDH